MSSRKLYESKIRKETVEMLEFLLHRIKNGMFKVESKGYWKGVTTGKYLYRVDVINRKESKDSE